MSKISNSYKILKFKDLEIGDEFRYASKWWQKHNIFAARIKGIAEIINPEAFVGVSVWQKSKNKLDNV